MGDWGVGMSHRQLNAAVKTVNNSIINSNRSQENSNVRTREFLRNTVIKIGKKWRRRFDVTIARYSEIPNTPVFNRDQFEWAGDLERDWKMMRDEALTVLRDREKIPPLNKISPDHSRIAKGDDWQSFFLWGYGFRFDENCAVCPKTAAMVERIAGLKTAMFSILAPGAHIPPHTGVTKAIINCHLGLITPAEKDACWIKIDQHRYGWSDGKVLIFDDTYKHEVRNETDQDRVVLLIQVSRPVRFPGSLAAKFFFSAVKRSPFISDARKNLRNWKR